MRFLSGLLAIAPIMFSGSSLAEEPPRPSPPSPPTCWEIVRNRSTADNNDKCVAMAGQLAAVRSGKLVLRMNDGQRKNFGDHSDETAYGYALMDFYPATHIFVVGDMGDDGGTFQAIDGRSGRVMEFGSSQPHYAPHGDWILLDSYDEDETGAGRTSFSLLDARGDNQRSVWTSKADPTTLPGTAEFIAWRDDAHAELALPGGFHLTLTHSGEGPWHYDLAELSPQKVTPEEKPAPKTQGASLPPAKAARP